MHPRNSDAKIVYFAINSISFQNIGKLFTMFEV